MKRLSPMLLKEAIKTRFQEKTGEVLYEKDESTDSSPFYYLELTKKKNEDNDTLFIDVYTVTIFAIAPTEQVGRKTIDQMIEDVEVALECPVQLPENYLLIRQIEQLVDVKTLESSTRKKATFEYEFYVAYGVKVKN